MERLDCSFPCRLEDLQLVRVATAQWLAASDIEDAEARSDVIFAAHEAAADAMEHSRCREIQLKGWVEGDEIYVQVESDGPWESVEHASPGRGRGLQLVRRLMNSVIVDARRDGTTIHMRRTCKTGRRRLPAGASLNCSQPGRPPQTLTTQCVGRYPLDDLVELRKVLERGSVRTSVVVTRHSRGRQSFLSDDQVAGIGSTIAGVFPFQRGRFTSERAIVAREARQHEGRLGGSALWWSGGMSRQGLTGLPVHARPCSSSKAVRSSGARSRRCSTSARSTSSPPSGRELRHWRCCETQPDLLVLLSLHLQDMDGLARLRTISQQYSRGTGRRLLHLDRGRRRSLRARRGSHRRRPRDSRARGSPHRPAPGGAPLRLLPAARLRSIGERGQRGAAGLTRRELQVLRLAAEGLSNAEIASSLWLAEQTVKFHLSNIYRRLGVGNRTEATRYAQLNGLLAGAPVPTLRAIEGDVPDAPATPEGLPADWTACKRSSPVGGCLPARTGCSTPSRWAPRQGAGDANQPLVASSYRRRVSAFTPVFPSDTR